MEDFSRTISFPKDYSFFLFGPRGVGKSTLIQKRFAKNSLYINLLDPKQEARFINDPNELENIIRNLKSNISHVIIDEVQKIPVLLDLVHLLIETQKRYFILTGSSARKLKRGNANLLAGRAFTYNLYALSSIELASRFDLNHALHWGMLPKIYQFDDDTHKQDFLEAYAHTYLKEEIWAEQFIKDLDPFRKFLEVAAQMNGKILNISKIAKDVGVDDSTIKRYYSILEDTLIGFFLNAYQDSFRKQLSTKPKFYFFDTGVVRALSYNLSSILRDGTYAYGNAFEHFVILECIKLASYHKKEYRFSYLKTKDNAEIDLVVQRPNKPILLIEIKSSKQVKQEDISGFTRLVNDYGKCEAVCFSRDDYVKNFGAIKVYPWQEGLKKLFT